MRNILLRLRRHAVGLVLASVALFFMYPHGVHSADTDTNKVPDSYAARLWKLKYDEAGQQNQLIALQAQFQRQADPYQQTIAHDEQEINSIKKEACEAAKNGDDCDVDLTKMEWTSKPKPAPTPPKK